MYNESIYYINVGCLNVNFHTLYMICFYILYFMPHDSFKVEAQTQLKTLYSLLKKLLAISEAWATYWSSLCVTENQVKRLPNNKHSKWSDKM